MARTRWRKAMRLILNGKRSALAHALAPHLANWLSVIHDNFEMYFNTDM